MATTESFWLKYSLASPDHMEEITSSPEQEMELVAAAEGEGSPACIGK
jgi:hypothetical protein